MFHILILDDDKMQHFIYAKLVGKIKTQVETNYFFDGHEAIAFLSKNALLPDVIVTDLIMPFMSGWDFLDAFVDILPLFNNPVSVYIVSSSVDLNDHERSKNYPFPITFLPKPVAANFFLTLSEQQAQ